MRAPLRRVVEMTDAVVAYQRNHPVAQWHWGPGLQGFAYARLQAYLGDERYTDLLLRYCRHHARGDGPVVAESDTAAPGLISFELERIGYPEFALLTRRVVNYIRHAPRDVAGTVNHLGHSFWARVYPRSAWVDSLMMFGVFPALVGRQRGDQDLLDAAADLPLRCAALLQHPSGLWAHSFWAPAWHSPRGRRYPSRVFWARGNGWVIAALPMIIEALGPHPAVDALEELLVRTSAALLPLQRPDGGWTTVLTGHPAGRTETSAAALIAAGWLTAVRLGLLPDVYVTPARRALDLVRDRIVDGAAAVTRGPIQRWFRTTSAAAPGPAFRGPALTGVSGPTIPLPFLPRWGYTHLVPDVVGASYGVAAVILAAIADDQLG